MVWTGGSVDDAMFRRTGPAAEQGDKREGGDLREVVVVCRLAALGLFFPAGHAHSSCQGQGRSLQFFSGWRECRGVAPKGAFPEWKPGKLT